MVVQLRDDDSDLPALIENCAHHTLLRSSEDATLKTRRAPSSAMSNPSSSYADIPPPSTGEEVDSLPSSSAGSTTSVSPSEEDDALSDAEREWRESLQQLELLLTMVVVPYIGKYFGRKCAYWGWAKFMEWKYPVTIEVTSSAAFKGAGAVEAAASL